MNTLYGISVPENGMKIARNEYIFLISPEINILVSVFTLSRTTNLIAKMALLAFNITTLYVHFFTIFPFNSPSSSMNYIISAL